MSKDNLKKKRELDKSSREKKTNASDIFTSGEKTSQSLDEQTKVFWSEIVSSLQKEEFQTVEAATSAIIEKVIAKLPEKSNEEELRNFLTSLVETDIGLKEKIESLLVTK